MTSATRSLIEVEIARIAVGDRAAFDSLYVGTSARLYAVCRSVLKDRAEAEAALADVYIAVWRDAARYPLTGLAPMTWLVVLARSHAIARLRGGPAAVPGPDLPVAAASPARPAPAEPPPMQECMARLDPDCAAAVRQVCLEGMDHAGVAATQRIPLREVRGWLRESLLWLRECAAR